MIVKNNFLAITFLTFIQERQSMKKNCLNASKKPSLITDLSKCKVDTNYVEPDPYVPPKSNANNLKIFFLFFLLISYLF